MLRNCNIALCIILSIVTCGLYSIYWYITVIDDVNTASWDSSSSVFLTYDIIFLYWFGNPLYLF